MNLEAELYGLLPLSLAVLINTSLSQGPHILLRGPISLVHREDAQEAEWKAPGPK